MELIFNKSQELSVGVEIELQLINLNSFNLSHDAVELLRRLDKLSLPGEIKPEVSQGMIEINTTIHNNFDSMLQELQHVNSQMVNAARQIDIGLSGGGTHPFQEWRNVRIFPHERFETAYDKYGYLSKQFKYALQVHIGCGSGDMAIKLCHLFARYIPHFIALSASSPFYQQADTGFDSSRQNVIIPFPTSGTIPDVTNWREFEKFFYKIINLKIINSIKDLYWDIRPKPEFGTIEIRVCDTPLQITKSISIAAYVHAIAAKLMKDPMPDNLKDIYLVYKHNKFQAAKHGLNGTIIDANGNFIKIYDDILQTIKQIREQNTSLNSFDHIKIVEDSAAQQKNDATWLRNQYTNLKTFPDLVRNSVDLWSKTD